MKMATRTHTDKERKKQIKRDSVAYIYILDIYRRNDNRRKQKDAGMKDARRKTQEEFFNKIYTSHFICKGSKGLFKVCMWEGARDRTWTSYFDPTVMTVTLCLSCSPYVGVNSIGAFRGPPWSGVAFPTTGGL